jgi:hypothetical protein
MTDENRGVQNAPASAAKFDIPPELAFRTALASPLVPKLYANQFWTIIQPVDLAVMIGVAGQPTGIVSMSYSVAKTFAAKLQEAIAGYEKQTGTTIPAADALEAKLRESNEHFT